MKFWMKTFHVTSYNQTLSLRFNLFYVNLSIKIIWLASNLALLLVIEDIGRKRTSYPQKDGLYFISPTNDSISGLIEDFTRTKPMYACAHVFFTGGIITAVVVL